MNGRKEDYRMLHRELGSLCGGSNAHNDSILGYTFKRTLLRTGKRCAR